MDELEGFERKLVTWIASDFTPGCRPCTERRREMAPDVALEWALLDPAAQTKWLDTHERDRFGAGLRDAVDVSLADGRDMVSVARELEARWPKRAS